MVVKKTVCSSVSSEGRSRDCVAARENKLPHSSYFSSISFVEVKSEGGLKKSGIDMMKPCFDVSVD